MNIFKNRFPNLEHRLKLLPLYPPIKGNGNQNQTYPLLPNVARKGFVLQKNLDHRIIEYVYMYSSTIE